MDVKTLLKRNWNFKAVLRWWIVGLTFYFLTLGALYVLREILHINLLLSTVVCLEPLTLVRFWLNDRWVFDQKGGGVWKRLWQFHVANAGNFAVALAVTNILPLFGVNYLIASTAGTASSVLLSMVVQFSWVWGPGGDPPQPASAVPEGAEETRRYYAASGAEGNAP